jgi:predicted transcriptional regulator
MNYCDNVAHLTIAIRAARGALHWSQADLAEKSGVSVPTIARLENDANPTMSTVLALLRPIQEHGVQVVWREGGFDLRVEVKKVSPLRGVEVCV